MAQCPALDAAPPQQNESLHMADTRPPGTVAYRPGQHNIQRWGLDIHHPVFPVSAVLAILFVAGVLFAPGPARESFESKKSRA